MSSILPLGASQTPSYGVTSTDSAPTTVEGVFEGIAGLLSMSPSDLQSALGSGQTIASIASQKGVSTDSITDYVEQQIQEQRAAQGQAPLSQQTLETIADNVVNGHGHHHRGSVGSSTSATDTSSPGASDATPAGGTTAPSSPGSGSTFDLFA